VDWRIRVAQHAAERRAVEVRQELSRGVFGLATVAATAPFFGLLGNVLGILNSFHGIDGERSSIMGAIAGCLSDSIVPTAFGVAVAVVAWVAQHYFRSRIEEFEAEMRCAVLALPAQLSQVSTRRERD
jgi:biopolymer transport protein ExbB/biopolymer transport protein TolQ